MELSLKSWCLIWKDKKTKKKKKSNNNNKYCIPPDSVPVHSGEHSGLNSGMAKLSPEWQIWQGPLPNFKSTRNPLRRNLCGRVKTLKIHPIDILSSQYNHSIHLLGDSLALSKSGGKAHLIKSANQYEVCIEGWCMECMSVCYLVLFAIDLVTLNNVPFIILKLPSIALVESPA